MNATTPALITALFPLPAVAAAPTWSPSSLFSGWSENGTSITVPISSFDFLTAATADAISGDARQVIASICTAAFEWYNELATKPEAAVLTYTPGRMVTIGDFAGKQKEDYKFTFYLDFPEHTVTAEPEA